MADSSGVAATTARVSGVAAMTAGGLGMAVMPAGGSGVVAMTAGGFWLEAILQAGCSEAVAMMTGVDTIKIGHAGRPDRPGSLADIA